ncbi:MAG: YchF/TatD family DNA exonuclease [Bradyrhizobiaceae bacterium]|nr:YchF/TatD family DNA exonuclease [Bradyrhizobiaceae bacterium]
MIDSHAHIDTKPFDADRDAMLQRAIDGGLQAIIIPDIEPARRDHLITVTNSHPMLYRGIGIHPHHVQEVTDHDLEHVEQGATAVKVVAIGEIGLDYYYDFAEKSVQQHCFREQLRIAKRKNLPVIVHNREADDDVLTIIEEEQDGTLRGVLHCFSSSVDVLRRALDAQFHVSFTGNITFKKSTLQQVVENVPDNRYMIETDSPYITPEPHRGKRNEPAYVALVAQKIAEIKGSTMQNIIDQTTQTTRKFFGLLAMLLVASTAALAQPKPPTDEDYPDDRDWEIALDNYYADSVAYEKWIKPRTLGFGISIGSQTNIEFQQFVQKYDPRLAGSGDNPNRWTTYKTDEGPKRSSSFDGLLSAGATLTYGINPEFLIEATFLYSENTGPAKDYGLDPITTTVLEGVVHYNLNPYKKINFLPQLGATFATIDDGTIVRSKFGINFGVGLGMNIPTPIGLFYPMFNVRFNLLLGRDMDRIVTRYLNEVDDSQWANKDNPTMLSEDKADVNTMFSIPRLTILYYFPF